MTTDTFVLDDDEIPRRPDTVGGFALGELLWEGATAQVRAAHERSLDRHVAMKLLRSEFVGDPRAVHRFVHEGRVLAGLQHPGILPVYSRGVLDDGRPWIAMPIVAGRPFPGPVRNLRAAVSLLRQVALAVAHAHGSGVIHRDLKPDNVLVHHGHVLVVDWGLALRFGARELEGRRQVAGTPRFMAPEQFRGHLSELGPWTDVFALGVMLEDLGGDADLQALAEAARREDPALRPTTAAVFADRLTAWLDGTLARERAHDRVREAVALDEGAELCRARARDLRARAEARLSLVQPWDSELDKEEGWRLEDLARAAEVEAAIGRVRAEALYRAALSEAPDLDVARLPLVRRLLDEHRVSSGARDRVRAAALHAALVAEVALLVEPPARIVRYLAGQGVVTIPAPADAEVTLTPLVERRRRLVPGTPLAEHRGAVEREVPLGSYVAEVRAPGRAVTRYPVFVDGDRDWSAVPPGGTEVVPMSMVPEGALGPDDLHVPAGWFLAGGDPEGHMCGSRRWAWCHDFVLRRRHVTHREYIAFLDDLVATGREQEALEHAPRDRIGRTVGGDVPIAYGRDERGGFVLVADAEGDEWSPEWPVFLVDFAGACAYVAWLADRSGLPWRLPGELEVEKAARGVDGRLFPWGDHFDPSWCNNRKAHPERPLPSEAGAFPVDESVYGLQDFAGNVRDWCLDRQRDGGAQVVDQRVVLDPWPPSLEDGCRRANRGGVWAGTVLFSRCANRGGSEISNRDYMLGIRPCRSLLDGEGRS